MVAENEKRDTEARNYYIKGLTWLKKRLLAVSDDSRTLSLHMQLPMSEVPHTPTRLRVGGAAHCLPRLNQWI